MRLMYTLFVSLCVRDPGVPVCLLFARHYTEHHNTRGGCIVCVYALCEASTGSRRRHITFDEASED